MEAAGNLAPTQAWASREQDLKPRYNLERVEYNQGILLLQGWLVAEGGQPNLRLHGISPEGQPWEQNIELNQDRPDVGQALHLPLAKQRCGFFCYTRVPAGQLLELRVEVQQQTHTLHSWQEKPRTSAVRTRWRSWRYYLGRAWRLLRGGQWRGLKEKVTRHVASAIQAWRAGLRPDAGLTAESWGCLVVDHDLGGGANHYRRQQLIPELQASNASIAFLTFSVLSLKYMVYRLGAGNTQQVVAALSWEQLQQWLNQNSFDHVFYNDAVSFPHALELVECLTDYKKQQPQCHLTIAVHDYFAICPSQHLLNASGQYCGIPDLQTCRTCLTHSGQAMVPLYNHHGIEGWRSQWSAFLAAADEVRIFDASAQTALKKAYPALSPALQLRPHQVPPLSPAEETSLRTWQQRKKRPSGRIGVVGAITSEAKGAKRLAELVQTIASGKKPYTVVVIGECPVMPGYPLKITGPYRPEQLTPLLIANDIDILFFTSVVPETFSYVLHELMRYQLPMAAFDLGAQSTFLTNYPSAVRLGLDESSEEILKKLEPYSFTQSNQ